MGPQLFSEALPLECSRSLSCIGIYDKVRGVNVCDCILPREEPSDLSLAVFPAVDRSVSATLSDARDALVNAVIDSLAAYRSSVLSIQQPGLTAPFSLRLFPLYILALLKQVRGERKPGKSMVFGRSA